MSEENINVLTDKNDRVILNGDIFTYQDSQWVAIYDEKIESWLGHPIGNNLATEDISLSEINNDIEISNEN